MRERCLTLSTRQTKHSCFARRLKVSAAGLWMYRLLAPFRNCQNQYNQLIELQFLRIGFPGFRKVNAERDSRIWSCFGADRLGEIESAIPGTGWAHRVTVVLWHALERLSQDRLEGYVVNK
jgi:hypothetical protein